MQGTGTTRPEGHEITYETREESTIKRRTPLPKFQLFIVFLIQFAEPVTATVIYPFINQFVRETGVTQGDERKTGYYAGIIVSHYLIVVRLTTKSSLGINLFLRRGADGFPMGLVVGSTRTAACSPAGPAWTFDRYAQLRFGEHVLDAGCLSIHPGHFQWQHR
jgi:hypothetical protein